MSFRNKTWQDIAALDEHLTVFLKLDEALKRFLEDFGFSSHEAYKISTDSGSVDRSSRAQIYVQVLIINRTASPVADAVLELTAPDGARFGLPPPLPAAPKPPTSPTDALVAQDVLAMLAGIRDVPMMASMPRPAVAGALRVRVEPKWAELRPAEPLRPDHEAYAGKLWIALTSDFAEPVIEIPYTLYAAVASKPISGTLTIPIRQRHEPWAPPAELPTYDNPNVSPPTRGDQFARYAAAVARK